MEFREREKKTYLDQELRDHLHVVVGLGHLLHAVGAEDWKWGRKGERNFHFHIDWSRRSESMQKHNKHMRVLSFCKYAKRQ